MNPSSCPCRCCLSSMAPLSCPSCCHPSPQKPGSARVCHIKMSTFLRGRVVCATPAAGTVDLLPLKQPKRLLFERDSVNLEELNPCQKEKAPRTQHKVVYRALEKIGAVHEFAFAVPQTLTATACRSSQPDETRPPPFSQRLGQWTLF